MQQQQQAARQLLRGCGGQCAQFASASAPHKATTGLPNVGCPSGLRRVFPAGIRPQLMSAGEEALPQPGPEAAVAEAGTEDPATLSCEALRREGNLLYKQRRWDAACKHYTRALQRFDEGLESAGGDEGGTGGVDSSSSSSGRTNCLLNRAACYLKMERHGSAVKDCTQAIAADPKIVKAWYRRGEARYHMKLVDEARDDLAEALRLAPKDDQVRSLYEKAKKACTEGNDTRYWMENFDFSTGMFKQRLASSISPGEQFFRAASANDVGRLQALAELGAAQCDVNTRVNGYTALMSAASKGLTEAVSALLALPGVGRLESTEDGSTALHLAAADGHLGATSRGLLSVCVLVSAPPPPSRGRQVAGWGCTC
jgi:hypothetical protein